jgi:hypothetical protein
MSDVADAIERLCREHGLPGPDRYSQDWELELAPEYRTAAWLDRYIRGFQRPDRTDAERRLLMALTLSVADDLEAERSPDGAPLSEEQWRRIAQELCLHRDFYHDLIQYWSMSEKPLEDCFHLTARMRRIERSSASD